MGYMMRGIRNTYSLLCQNKNHVLVLPFILHQADLMAARIEFEREWLPKLNGKNSVDTKKKNYTLKGNIKSSKSKALNTISSPGLKNMLDNL